MSAVISVHSHADLTPAEVSAYYPARAPLVRQAGHRWRGPCPRRGKLEHDITRLFSGYPGGAAVWAELDSYLQRQWRHELGIALPIAACCIDSGYKSQAVYDACRTRYHRRVFAVNGQGGPHPISLTLAAQNPIPSRERQRAVRTNWHAYSVTIPKCVKTWSGRWGSNPRHPAWEAGVLPLNYSRSTPL